MSAAARPQIRVIGDGFPHAEPGGPFGSDLIAAPDILHVASVAAATPGGRDAVLFLVHSLEDETLVSFAADIRVASDCAVTLRLIAASDIVTLTDTDAAWLFPGATTTEVVNRVLNLGPSLVAVSVGGTVSVTTRHEAWSVPGASGGFLGDLLRTLARRRAGGLTANELREQGFRGARRAPVEPVTGGSGRESAQSRR